jgi:ubiquinone/menaquinone biosynthesis C-methylase UbiE
MLKIIDAPDRFNEVANLKEKNYRDKIQIYSDDTLLPWLKNKLTYYESLKKDNILALFKGKVLELGAGHCWLTALLSKREEVTEATAVDLSEKQVKEIAPKVIQYLKGQEEKIALMINDFNNLNFPESSFDTIIFDAALHHAVNPVATLKKIMPLLKNGGYLVCIREPIIPWIYFWNKKIIYQRHGVEEKKYGVTENIFTISEWKNIFKQAGTAVKFVKISYNHIQNPFFKKIFSNKIFNGFLFSEMIFVTRK